MALGDLGSNVVDLTNDSDDDDEDSLLKLWPVDMSPNRAAVPSPSSNQLPNRNALNGHHAAVHASTPRTPSVPTTASQADRRGSNGIAASSIPLSQPLRPSSAGSHGSKDRQSFLLKKCLPGASTYKLNKDGEGDSERAAKRLKMSTAWLSPSEGSQKTHRAASNGKVVGGHQIGVDRSTNASQTRPNLSTIPTSDTGAEPNLTNKLPTVQHLNNALQSNSQATSVLGRVFENQPRALKIGRHPEGAKTAGPSKSRVTSNTVSRNDKQRRGSLQAHKDLVRLLSDTDQSGSGTEFGPRVAGGMVSPLQSHPHQGSSLLDIGSPVGEGWSSRPSYFSGPAEAPQDDDKDSVMSDISVTDVPSLQQSIDGNSISVQPIQKQGSTPSHASLLAQSATSGAGLSQAKTRGKKYANPFTEEEDHYLIFLKEVKARTWKQITNEFNAEFPKREYPTLQSRYSTYLNKRDREQDSVVLSLPSRFAAEATINWERVHALNPGPRARVELATLPQSQPAAPRPSFIRQTTEQDYSSGDNVSLRARSHRAKRVNYTLPRHRYGASRARMEEPDEAIFEDLIDPSVSARSETPAEVAIAIPDAAVAVDNEPIPVNFIVDDAQIALSVGKRQTRFSQNQPYLSYSQRCALREPAADWDWDQLPSRQWQGSLVHVDFSSTEIGIVKETIAQIQRTPRASRHSSKRRQLRDLLKDFTDPRIVQLRSALRRELPTRDTSSIAAFLDDAIAGKIADAPQIKRLAAARPQTSTSTTQKTSTATMIRQRELGHFSRRGWQAASKPLTYQHRNKVMDTLGPVFSWTGASSDIHTVAWAPNGEYFAAGAVAVDDPHSMQYNRPNNLLYGDTSSGVIHELGEHTKKRQKTESGANSTHAMFVSQDPKIYSTVSSVAFSASGKVMYSAGYDGSLCVWSTNTGGQQPVIGAKLNVRAKIDMMAVNRHYAGVVATAANTTRSKAVRLLTLSETIHLSLQSIVSTSEKAVSRIDLNILPTALQFEPRFGGLLLAGFGANVRDNAFDTTGDLCLWEVETQTQMHIHGSGKNVFDIEFNPNRAYMPLFAIGCVAGAGVNRGTRSLVRVYDEQGDKYRCPLEIECAALDMNDIVWNPHNEYLIAAGCTDGRSYVWDLRWPDKAIRVLSHGRSLMPLQDGVAPEITDTGVRFLSWGDNATRLYSGSSDGVIKVWDVTRSEEDTFIKDLVTLDSGVMSGAFTSDMSKLVVGEVNGSVNVLEVGRDDCLFRDAEKFRYVPYDFAEDGKQFTTGGTIDDLAADSGVTEGNLLLHSEQIQFVLLGGLPIRQAVQGSQYAGPYDQSVDAPFLRQQALDFQLSLSAQPGPQCDIAICKDSTSKVTSEEIGDSGRSADRIPDELRLQWKAIDNKSSIIQGKSKCHNCGRPARPSFSDEAETEVLCERCSFACLRCGAPNYISPDTSILICRTCAGVWSIGALGYECLKEPMPTNSMGSWRTRKQQHSSNSNNAPSFDIASLDVPPLKKFGKEAYLERLEEGDTSFGDEVNALTDYYFSLAIDRPESPPL